MKSSALSPVARRLYSAMIAALGDQYDVSVGTHVEATIFARAKGQATTATLLAHAGAQQLPSEALEMLPEREAEYGLVPAAGATVATRRAAYAARRLLPAGASANNVSNALRALLGTDFVAYRPTPTASAVLWPTVAGAAEMNLALPSTPRKLIRITDAVAAAGTHTVHYTALSTDESPTRSGPLVNGDVFLVQPEGMTLGERVTLTSANDTQLTAVFAKSHDAGCLATTAPYPLWTSTKRYSLVVVSPTAAADPEKRRQINELMERVARGVSTWAITASSGGGGTTGPFTVGGGMLGITTIGAVTL